MDEIVVPMEGLPDPMEMAFTFKVVNVGGDPIYVSAQLVAPPAGWANYAEHELGELGVGVDDYYLWDIPTRTKPATDTEENVTLRITYYSDAYITEINHEDIVYTFTYVDFDDVGYALVDLDTFEADLEGWAKVDEVGSTTLSRSTNFAHSGVASMRQYGLTGVEATYATKSFTIAPGSTKAYIRIWMLYDPYSITSVSELIFELITDAGELSQKRTIQYAFDTMPNGGALAKKGVWVCLAAKIPISGTYEVRLRTRGEDVDSNDRGTYYDDIKVIEA